MTRAADPTDSLRDQIDDHLDDAKEKLNPWVEPAARIGFLTKGLTYIGLGVLAVRWVMGLGGEAPDRQSVFLWVASQPFGRFLLSALAGGLIIYGLWRLAEAAFNPEHAAHDAKGYGKRFAWLVSGIYGGIGIGAIGIAIGLRGGNAQAVQEWVRYAMSKPFGQIIVGIASLIVLGRGIHDLYKAWNKNLAKRLQLYRLDNQPRIWAIRLGRFGYTARGIVFLIIGVLLFMAALHANPSEAHGTSGEVRQLENAPYGPWLVGFLAFGFIAYGLFMVIEARYRRIRPIN